MIGLPLELLCKKLVLPTLVQRSVFLPRKEFITMHIHEACSARSAPCARNSV